MHSDINTLAEEISGNIINGNLNAANFSLSGTGLTMREVVLLTTQIVYVLSYKMEDDIPAALAKVKKLVNN